MNEKYIIGIDLGATNIKTALIAGNKIILKKVLPTASFPSRQSLIQAVCDQISGFRLKAKTAKKDILAVGLGLPGPIDSSQGIVHYFPNIKGWRNVPLKKILEKKTGLPVFIDNDANLMCLAESRIGAARNKKNVIGLTLGTGVGGGILLNGSLYRGSSLTAGEIGHMPLNQNGPKCNCGGWGCLERYIGNKHILEKGRKEFGKDISLEELSSLANKGNNQARRIWTETAGYLGLALAGIVNLLNPESIVIGGGVSGAGEAFFEAIRKVVKERAMPIPAKTVRIIPAKLGNNAGMLGAAFLAKEELSKKYR